jgi:chromosome segregation ATPase
MRPLNRRLTIELILGIALAISLVLVLRQSHQITVYRRQQESDAKTLRVLAARLREAMLPTVLPLTEETNITASDHVGIARREATITRLDHDLAESRSNAASLQSQLNAANDELAKAQASADERLQKQQVDLQAQLDDLQKRVQAAQSSSDIARQRSAVLEADNAQLKTDTSTISARAAEVAKIISSLQDLERRRDVYMTSILRRYRDLADEFHAMSGMIDTSHEPGSSACSGAALSRIQTAVNSAEDDLRQMNELSARTQKLQKQLLKK